MYQIETKTVNGDVFIGRYSKLISRDKYIKDIGSNKDELIEVVKHVINWPKVVTVKRIELSFKNRRRIGSVIFSRILNNGLRQ